MDIRIRKSPINIKIVQTVSLFTIVFHTHQLVLAASNFENQRPAVQVLKFGNLKLPTQTSKSRNLAVHYPSLSLHVVDLRRGEVQGEVQLGLILFKARCSLA